MPDTSYSQYNTNAQAILTHHAQLYMAWYEAAVVVYVFAAAVFVAYWFFRNRFVLSAAVTLTVVGLCCQAISLGVRAYYSPQHSAWNDLYGSLSVVAFWAVLLFLVFGARFKIWFAGPLVLAITDGMLAFARGWNKGLEPLVPSLQSPFLFIHVPVVLASYAAFLIGFSTSILYLLKKWDEDRIAFMGGKSVGAAVATRGDSAGRPAFLSWLDMLPASSKLDVISYRVIAIGEILLTVGIILGGVWAHLAWGSYWQWDPKETAALASWAIYASYLHLHTRPAWRGPRAAWWSIVGFLSILFCYFGINIYVSTNSLHSYR
ncbi:MAG: c-type cytochrome biogenesis protein CcsB [Vulcanimicrobiaceae bacterium]